MKAIVIDKIKTEYQQQYHHHNIIPMLALTFLLGIPVVAFIYTISLDNVSALTYSEDVGLNFTFNPSITVSLSSASGGSNADLVINDLTPGTSSDSNTIIVNVLSNNANGYELQSTVGNSTTYDTRNLVHSNTTDSNSSSNSSSSSNATFTSLDYTTTPTITNPSDFNDNQWGYSYATSYIAGSGTELDWSNYNGLPLYSDTTNISTLRTSTGPSASTGDNTYFKIAAKASTTQSSGEYNNVINFTVTAEHNPMSLYDSYTSAGKTMYNGYYTMQDMTPSICNNVEVEESQLQVIDLRDNNVYTIAKLKDNRCWMTTNLDLPGGTALYSETSNVPEGYPESGGVPYYTLPKSSTVGFDDNTKAFVYNSNRNDPSYCSESPGCYSYYSWLAATANSGADISVANVDAPYSICSKSWKLPTGRYAASSKSELYLLAVAYGMNSGVSEESSSVFYNNAGPGTVANFLLGGEYSNSALIDGGGRGRYWGASSATLDDRPYHSFDLFLSASRVVVYTSNPRLSGYSVRCIANNS